LLLVKEGRSKRRRRRRRRRRRKRRREEYNLVEFYCVSALLNIYGSEIC
jgi:hypothetical protein